MTVPALTTAPEGTRLADYTMVAEANMKAIASNHPFVVGRLELAGMLVTSSGSQIGIVFSGGINKLWDVGEPYAEHRAIAVPSGDIADGVKVDTPWRPRCVLLHARAPSYNHAVGGEESRILTFQLEAAGVDIPQAVWVHGAGVSAGDRSPTVACEFHDDGFTITRSGTEASKIELVNAVVFGVIEGVPDTGFSGVQLVRPMISPSMTAQQIAEARNAALDSIRSRNRGPAAPESPLVGELWDDTETGWARQWTGEAWANVYPLGGDVDGLRHSGPFAVGFVPAFGANTTLAGKAQTAVLVQMTYPRGGQDGPPGDLSGLTSEKGVLLLDDGEHFALQVVKDPTAQVNATDGVDRVTVDITLAVTSGNLWKINKASADSGSTDAVAAVAIDNVHFLEVW